MAGRTAVTNRSPLPPATLRVPFVADVPGELLARRLRSMGLRRAGSKTMNDIELIEFRSTRRAREGGVEVMLVRGVSDLGGLWFHGPDHLILAVDAAVRLQMLPAELLRAG